MDDEKFPLAGISKAVNKSIGSNVLLPGDVDNVSTIKTWCPTGLTILDKFLYGGIPIGRIWEVYGDPSVGKTALIIQLMVAVQKYGGMSVYLDAEGTWHLDRALSMGHDPEKHLHLEADTIELGFQSIDKIIDTVRDDWKMDIPLLFVWDSLAESQTQTEKDGSRYGAGMANTSRTIREGLRRLSIKLSQKNSGLIFVNHTIASMEMFGPKTTTPGGKAPKFWASYRLEVKKRGLFQPKKKDIGIISEIKMVKCKLGPPSRKILIPLTYDHGWIEDYANFDFLTRKEATDKAKEFVYQKGSWYYIKGFWEWLKEENGEDKVTPKDLKLKKNEDIGLYYSQLEDKIELMPKISEYLKVGAEAEWESTYE